MKVIFTQHLPGVASRGEVKNVRPGFFRNYLLPYKKAVPATDALVKEWEERRKQIFIQKEELKSKLEEMKRRLTGGKLRIEKKLTAKGTLYGGLKPAEIVKAMKEHLKLEIPEEAVKLDAPIKSAGTYEIRLELGEGVLATVPVEIAAKA